MGVNVLLGLAWGIASEASDPTVIQAWQEALETCASEICSANQVEDRIGWRIQCPGMLILDTVCTTLSRISRIISGRRCGGKALSSDTSCFRIRRRRSCHNDCHRVLNLCSQSDAKLDIARC